MALAYLAPLPIMIAALGWGIDAGAIAMRRRLRHRRARSSSRLSGLLFAADRRPARLGARRFRDAAPARALPGARATPAPPMAVSVGAIVVARGGDRRR